MAVHAGGDRGAEGPPQPEGAPLCHWYVIMMRELLSVPPARNLAPAFLFLASSQSLILRTPQPSCARTRRHTT